MIDKTIVTPEQFVVLCEAVMKSKKHVIAECKRKNIPRRYWKHLLAKDDK